MQLVQAGSTAEGELSCEQVMLGNLAQVWQVAVYETGIILIWTLDHSEFAEILAGVERQLQQRPSQEQWRDITTAL